MGIWESMRGAVEIWKKQKIYFSGVCGTQKFLVLVVFHILGINKSRIDSRILLWEISQIWVGNRFGIPVSKTFESWSSKYSWDHKESGEGSFLLIFWSHPSLPGAAFTSWSMISTRIFWKRALNPVPKSLRTIPGMGIPPAPMPEPPWSGEIFLIFHLNSPAQSWGTFGRDPHGIQLLHGGTWLYLMEVWVFFTQFSHFSKPKKMFIWMRKQRDHVSWAAPSLPAL